MVNKSQKSALWSGSSGLYLHASIFKANPNGGEPGLIFNEMEHLGKLNLRADKSAFRIIKSWTGCECPLRSNTFTSAGERHVIWLSPDEYMIICEAGKDNKLTSSLDSALSGRHYSIINVTDAFTALNLRGSAVRKVLSKGCTIDLHQKQFRAGDSVQTLLSHAMITLMALSENEFIIICRTSFSTYLHDWLIDAALEYGVNFKK